MTNLFVYWTLMYPEIVFSLTWKNFRSQEAILYNYKRYAVKYWDISKPYPWICPKNNSSVSWYILFDLDDNSLKILDFFEDSEYYRKNEIVIFDWKIINVLVYIWHDSLNKHLFGDWDMTKFENNHLEYYINTKIPIILNNYYK